MLGLILGLYNAPGMHLFSESVSPSSRNHEGEEMMNLVPRGLDLNPNFTAASHSTFLPFCVNYEIVERVSVLSSLRLLSLPMDLKLVFKL